MHRLRVTQRVQVDCPCSRHSASAWMAFASSLRYPTVLVNCARREPSLRATRCAVYLTVILLGMLSSVLGFCAETNFRGTHFFSSPYTITIKTVLLKNDSGEWIKIIEPDRKVDLSKEEPVITFFNNMGRIPAGNYKNFRVEFYGEDLNAAKKFYSKSDFDRSVEVKKGSFVRVTFNLSLNQKITVDRADLAVDEDSREFLTDSLSLEA